jgi:hypothetical protein
MGFMALPLLLLALVMLVLTLITSGAGLFIWRARLIGLIRVHYPEALDAAQTTPDIISPVGRSKVSATRILEALDAAVPVPLQQPEVRVTARKLRIAKNVLLGCALILIALALVGRFLPRR